MHRNLWVTSDVQFRKGASIPPFLGGLGSPEEQSLLLFGVDFFSLQLL